MKSRTKQRENRRNKEEKLELRNYCGIKDPTPFQAVLNIIRKQGGTARA